MMKKRLGALVVAAVLGFSLFGLSSCGPSAEGRRVLVLGLDGMDPQTLDLLMSEGKLPNFSRLRQEGAYGRLESQKPILSPIIWTTIATGKTADMHGIGHFVAQSASGEQLPVTSHMRQVKALWNIVSDAGRSVATVGWWATWPPETVNGAVVSDHTAYHFLFEEGLTGESASDEGGQKTHPPELLAEIEPLLRRPQDLTYDELVPFVDVSEAEFSEPFDFQNDLAHFKWALATAGSYRDIGLKLWRDKEPDLELVYIEGTDSTSHLFGHLFRAEGLGGELAEQQQKFGRTVEEIYEFADRLLGEYLDALDDDTVLMVLSDHGFELGALHDDPSRTRDMRRVSEKFHRLHGILYMYGAGVRPGGRIQDASIIDIAPTVLSILGLPPAEDMPGRVLDEALIDLPDRPRIATYESGATGDNAGDTAAGTGSSAVSQAQLEHLRSLGYIGADGASTTVSPKGDRNLAAIHFQNGNFREAAKIYKALIDADPSDASLRASLAGVLGSMERYDAALVELNKAIELQPLNVEAFHNRAVIQERMGKSEAAVADYERALRYNPSYEPSKLAYQRLTGRSDVRAPRNEAEAAAAVLVRQAAEEARKANYEKALALLEQAESTAPSFVLTYQYRSNVAYLTGDAALGIAALEKALEFEPDNALFQANLAQLRAGADSDP